jgi:hypothetical protein
MRTVKPYEEMEVYLNIFLILSRDGGGVNFATRLLCPDGKITDFRLK